MQASIPLLENVNASAVLADKAYDTNELREWLECRGIKAVIPPKSNRKEEIECDYWHYKERHAVECMFGFIGAFMAEMKRQQNLALATKSAKVSIPLL
ncbi:MAG: transposase [Methylobacter sp.]|nr:transposase [Methylobacter sp.]